MPKWKEMMKGHNDKLVWEKERCQCHNTVIIKEMHIVNNLKIKILIDINILILENISIMLLSRKAIVNSYDNIELSLTVTT